MFPLPEIARVVVANVEMLSISDCEKAAKIAESLVNKLPLLTCLEKGPKDELAPGAIAVNICDLVGSKLPLSRLGLRRKVSSAELPVLKVKFKASLKVKFLGDESLLVTLDPAPMLISAVS